MTDPLGVRSRNPGNIRYVEGVTSTYPGCMGRNEHGFCIFDTPQNGVRAIVHLLLVYKDVHGINTIRGAINRWAPPSENDTGAYVNYVASVVGIGPDVETDLEEPSVMRSMVVAIGRHENGRDAAGRYEFDTHYPDDIIDAGVALGLRLRTEDVAASKPAEATPMPASPQPVPGPAPSPQSPLGAIIGAVTAIDPRAALIANLAGTLIESFSALGKQKITSDVNAHANSPQVGQKVFETVVDSAKQVTGLDNPLQAVAAAQGNPEVIAKVEADALDDLDKLAPLLERIHQMEKESWVAAEDSMDRAAKRTPTQWDMTKLLVVGSLSFIGTLTLFVCSIAAAQVVIYPGHAPTTEVWAAITGLLGTAAGILATVFAYRFGRQPNSTAVQEAINAIDRRR